MLKKGQAAMEFLMTYGWAILAAIVVIGVLAYFGVFSPSTYVPNQCIVSAPFGCVAGTAAATGVDLEIRNCAGESVTVSSVAVAGCGTASSIGEVADGATATVNVLCNLTGNKFNGDITITYIKSGSALSLTSSGKLVDKI